HESNLAAELMSGFFGHAPANRLDESQHVSGSSTLRSLDEVGVLRRDLGGADAPAAPTPLVDDLARPQLVRDRIDEHRAAVLPARLVLAAPSHDLGHFLLATFAVSWRQLDGGVDDHLMIGDVAAAEAEAELADGEAARRPRAEIDDQRVDE